MLLQLAGGGWLRKLSHCYTTFQCNEKLNLHTLDLEVTSDIKVSPKSLAPFFLLFGSGLDLWVRWDRGLDLYLGFTI